jgi:ubiquinone/menaquinone biosynthesis C-methylase UbiE
MSEQDKSAEQKFFDRFDREGGYERFDERGYRRLLDEAQRLVDPKPGEIVVDMGCGSGAFTAQLARRFPSCRLTGLDLSEGCIARAKAEYRDIVFKTADAEETGLAAASVDVLCYSGILHHFPDFSKVAAEAFRLLKPGGRFFSYDPHHRNPAFWLYRAKASPFYSLVGVTANERLLTKTEVVRVFSGAGLSASARVISGVTFTYVESGRVRPLLGIYNALDRALGATPLASWLGAWVIGSGVKPE